MTHQRSLRGHTAAALLLALATAGQAQAGCTVSSSGMAFGAYQPLTFAGKLTSVDVTSNASISVVCSGIATGGAYTIALGPSTAGNSISPRYLSNLSGGDNMVFNIYTAPTYSTIWGDGTTGAVISGGIPTGDSNQSQTVYGKIPAGQNMLRAGSFSGSMTMTLTYNP